jgi:hypothetical protein
MSMRRHSRRDYILFGLLCTAAMCGFVGILLVTTNQQPRVSETFIPTENAPVSPIMDVPEGLRDNPGIEASTAMMEMQVAQIDKTIAQLQPVLATFMESCILAIAQEKSLQKTKVQIIQTPLEFRSQVSESGLQESILPDSCNGLTTVAGMIGATVAAQGGMQFKPIVLNLRVNEGIQAGDTAALNAMTELLHKQIWELKSQNAVRQRLIRDISSTGGNDAD